MSINKRFATYAWGVLAYNILVILWGAFVRATGSGAGCGSHWPLCNGVVIPRAPQIETMVEFAHRITSGLAGLVVLALFIWAFRAYPRQHLVRKGAAFSLLFIITESLLGAGLVLFEWVAYNDSVERVVSMALHLNNTFLLLAAMTLTAWWATNHAPDTLQRARQRPWGTMGGFLLGGVVAMMVLSTAGAITALGDTLFPAGTLAEGIARDFSPTAHFLERLRIWHPILAILTGAFLFVIATNLINRDLGADVYRFARGVQVVFGLQLAAGFLNVYLLAPVWMQLVHLLLADAIWILLVLLTAAYAAQPETVAETSPAAQIA